jgi:hypothetical protein
MRNMLAIALFAVALTAVSGTSALAYATKADCEKFEGVGKCFSCSDGAWHANCLKVGPAPKGRPSQKLSPQKPRTE